MFTHFVAHSARNIHAACLAVLVGGLLLLQGSLLQAAECSLSLSEELQRALAENPSLQTFRFSEQLLNGQLATATLKPAYALGVELENVAGSGEFNGFDQADITVFHPRVGWQARCAYCGSPAQPQPL
ncbi:hypothetical protein [Dasania marina]|uniref:hypothetical protein n=1 Tax=Dasania marina TaxID=471499 RepID=UPI0030D77678|tara:strand:+ start:42683 stop:43066 length:384 start_codon:yes stop_codon:yes gene_type:complete